MSGMINLGTLARYAIDASGNVTGLLGPDGMVYTNNRTTSPIVLCDGDSITARYLLTALPATEGASNASSGHSSGSYLAWEQAQLHNTYTVVSQAVPGETIEQITARLLATNIDGYAAVSLMCGTNNIDGSVVGDAATDAAMIGSVAAYCLARAKPLRVLTVLPPDASVMTANEKAYLLALNHAIKMLPMSYPNVFVGDAFAGLQDTSAADPTPIAGTIYTGDAGKVHPTKIGAFLAAEASVASMEDALRYAGYGRVIDGRFSVHDDSPYTERLTNTDFKTQTGGTNSLVGGVLTVGAVPSGWRIDDIATPTNAKIYYPFYVPEAARQRGIWVTGYVYLIDDAVTDTGGAYICTAGHTAGATFAGDAANWRRVWATDYCWQIEFTGGAAGDGVNIFRSSILSAVTATMVVQGFCGLAVEGETTKIKGDANGHFQIEAYGVTRAHFNCAGLPPSGVTEESVGERFEGEFQTSRAAFFSGGGTIQSQQFRIGATLNAAGTASIIIYRPSLRSYP